jgi:hypothetical protein
MCAALTNDDPFDVCSTDRAGFSSPIVNSKMILIFSAAIDPIKGGAVAANAFLQDAADRSMQPLGLAHRDRIRRGQGMQLCEMQRFIGVNIAKPGKKA